jgi:hypothetical protein
MNLKTQWAIQHWINCVLSLSLFVGGFWVVVNATSWQLALGIFLLIWANNLGMNLKKGTPQ